MNRVFFVLCQFLGGYDTIYIVNLIRVEKPCLVSELLEKDAKRTCQIH